MSSLSSMPLSSVERKYLASTKPTSCKTKVYLRKMVDGLFLEICRETAKKYPNILFEEVIVDNACMQMVKNPSQFDVLVMPNLYGSILGSLGAGLVGGAGLVSSASFGPNHMMFEPGTRNSGHALVGKNIANPSSMIIAASNMLRTVGLPFFGDMIRAATRTVYIEGKYLTKDVGGNASTTDFTKRVVEEIQNIKNTSIAN